MTVCKFYLEGRCTFGPKCKYEHRQPNSSELNNRIGWNNSYNQQQQAFEEKSIRTDLTKERPPWPYTVYAPAKEEQNLIEGTDISQEELRFEFFKLKSFWMYGGEMQYNQGVSQLNNVMKQKTDEVLKDLRNAIRTYVNKTRPQSGAHSSNTFGGGNTSQQQSNNAFRSNSGFSQPQQGGFGNNRYGNSGFGRQQQSGFGSSGFNQQSNFGGGGFTQQQQPPLQQSSFAQQPGPGFGVAQQNGGFGGFHQQQPQQTGLGLGIPPQSNTLGTFSSTGNPPAPTFGQAGFGGVSNTLQQNPLGQSTQNPFGTQQQPSSFGGGGMQGAKPDGMSEYFTGQVPTSPPPNHY